MRGAIQNPGERCLFELLAYTGQRIRVIQPLRIQDIDLENSMFNINEPPDAFEDTSGKRPLLGAEAYVRSWLDYHPAGGREDYLITPQVTGDGKSGRMLTQESIRYHLRKIADKAAVEKDVYPHIIQHYFTTIAKREYGLDNFYIRHLRGDALGSNVMETTYRHLSNEDVPERATARFEGSEPEPKQSLSPETCPTRWKILDPGAKACANVVRCSPPTRRK